MPYKEAQQRKQAARKWRLSHRAERAAYMRRYRKARSSGRSRGRPRSSEGTLRRQEPLLDSQVQVRPQSQLAGSMTEIPTGSRGSEPDSTDRIPPKDPGGEGTSPPREQGFGLVYESSRHEQSEQLRFEIP
jgi:hypothetical protein